MFGATAVRAKRERERREKAARGSEPTVYPYIAPFPVRFSPEDVPYFKYRRALEECKEKGRVRVFFLTGCTSPILFKQKGSMLVFLSGFTSAESFKEKGRVRVFF
jgi:hypothetical protein